MQSVKVVLVGEPEAKKTQLCVWFLFITFFIYNNNKLKYFLIFLKIAYTTNKYDENAYVPTVYGMFKKLCIIHF